MSKRLAEHTARLSRLLDAWDESHKGSWLSRMVSRLPGVKRPPNGREAEEIKNELVEVERLIRWVSPLEDHSQLPLEMRAPIRKRLKEAEQVFVRAYPAFPLDQIRTAYAEYIDYLLKTYAYVDPRGVMQTERTVSLPMDKVYVALTAERETEPLGPWREPLPDEGEDDFEAHILFERERSAERVELAPTVRQHGHIVLLGDPGAGKTTLLRFLAYRFAKAHREGLPTAQDDEGNDYGPTRLPILLRIAEYADAFRKSRGRLELRDFLPDAFPRVPVPREDLAAVLYGALDDGQALVLLDGLDEIADSADRVEIARRIEAFAAGHSANRFVVTSRIAGYREARLGGAFAQTTYTLRDMQPDQIERFLQRWCTAFERSQKPDASEEALSAGAQKQTGKILAAMDRQGGEGVRRLAGNPLLLTILALIHRNGLELPRQRVQLYALAVKTLCRTWGLARGLDAQELMDEGEVQRLLSPLAYWMHEHEPTGLIEESVAQERLERIRAEIHGVAPDDPENRKAIQLFLRRVREQVGLFVERAPGRYGFMHLTFEEYFAGRELVRRSREAANLIYTHRHRPRWEESILLAIGFESNDHPEDAADLIRTAILAEGDAAQAAGYEPSEYEEILHRDLLFAACCIGDCASADAALARDVAGRLVELCLEVRGWEFTPLRERIGAALRALGQVGREQALTALLHVLQNDQASYVRGSAAWALGQIGGEAALAALLGALQDKARNVLGSAARALGQVGGDQALAALLGVLQDKASDVREMAALALGQIGGEQALAALLSALHDEANYVRGSAARALGQIGGEQALAALLHALHDEDSDVRRSAAWALGQVGGEQALAALLCTCQDEDSYIRGIAARALGQIGGEQALAALLSALHDEADYVRGRAARALGQIGGEQALTALLHAIQDEDSDVRGSAARALGRIGGDQALASLLHALHDEDSNVRMMAAWALGRLRVKTPEVVDVVLSALRDEKAYSWISTFAWETLWNLSQAA